VASERKQNLLTGCLKSFLWSFLNGFSGNPVRTNFTAYRFPLPRE
jgi:hypothetical protein